MNNRYVTIQKCIDRLVAAYRKRINKDKFNGTHDYDYLRDELCEHLCNQICRGKTNDNRWTTSTKMKKKKIRRELLERKKSIDPFHL